MTNELLATSPYYRAVNLFATSKPARYADYLGQSRSYDAGGFAPIFISSTPTDYVQMRRGHDSISEYHVGVNGRVWETDKARRLNEATGNPFKAIRAATGPQYRPHLRFVTAREFGF